MRRLTLAILGLSIMAMLVCVLIFFVLPAKNGNKELAVTRILPDENRITKIRASLVTLGSLNAKYAHVLGNKEHGSIDLFEVPKDHFKNVLDCLECEYVIDEKREPITPWIGLGRLLIELDDHSEVVVYVYMTKGPVGEFCVDSGHLTVKCRGGNDERFIKAVVESFLGHQRRRDGNSPL
jgi:hypothetical protein